MTAKRPNGRRVKKHRTYEVEELARQVGVHPNTVRRWIAKDGLSVIDDRRPTLIKGDTVRAFFDRRKQTRKQSCRPGEIYCVRCREPKRPAEDIADYLPLGSEHGNLQGICPDCGNLIYRGVSLVKLDIVRGDLEVAIPEALQRI